MSNENYSYSTGTFSSPFFHIYNKDGTPFKTLFNEAQEYQVYVVKYDSNGFGQWATQMGGTLSSDDEGYTITTDLDNNVYVTGNFYDTSFTIYNANGKLFKTLTSTGSGYNVFVVKYNFNGYGLWATQMGGTSSTNDFAYGITTDRNNNVYVTGSFQDVSFNIYNENGNLFKTLSNTGVGEYVFVVKYNSSGYGLWATQIVPTIYAYGYFISTDANNNVYITGSFYDTSLTIYNENGDPFTILTNTGLGKNVFVVKYNSSGYGEWATQMEGTSLYYTNNDGYGITTDANNNVYVTGFFEDASFNIYNANGSLFETLSNTGSGSNVFVVKYNSNGYGLWATKMGGTSVGYATGNSITTDLNNNVYVTGIYYDDSFIIYDKDNNPFKILTNTGGSIDVFVVKYNSSGYGLWATKMEGTSDNYSSGISTDLNNYVYITGSFQSDFYTIYNENGDPFTTLTNTNIGTNIYDVFVVKYNSSGYGEWATKMGGLTGDSYANSICCNKSPYIYIGNPLLQSTNPSPLILFYPGTITLNYYGNLEDQYQLINNLGQVVSSTFSFNSTNQTITFNVIIQYGGNNILSFYDTTLNKLIGTFSIETSGICFKEGTKILCHLDKREKYVPIEQIQEDMLVKVYTGRNKKPEYKRASAIVKSQLINTPVTTINKLYRLPKSVCPQLIEDLYVTGSHALLHDQLTEEQHEKMTHLADFYNTYTIRLENEEAMSEEQRETLKSMMRSYNDYQTMHLDKFKLIAYYNKDFEEVNIEKVFNIYHIVLENVNKYENYGIYANGILAESTSEASLQRFPHYERINILAKKVTEDIPYI